jgi:hypothetical protein
MTMLNAHALQPAPKIRTRVDSSNARAGDHHRLAAEGKFGRCMRSSRVVRDHAFPNRLVNLSRLVSSVKCKTWRVEPHAHFMPLSHAHRVEGQPLRSHARSIPEDRFTKVPSLSAQRCAFISFVPRRSLPQQCFCFPGLRLTASRMVSFAGRRRAGRLYRP